MLPFRMCFLALTLIISSKSVAQNFTTFLEYIYQLPVEERQVKVDSFLSLHPQAPHIEQDTLCHFIYTGNASKVEIAVDFTNWSFTHQLQRVEGTHLWYFSKSFEADARLDYKFIINTNQWELDKRNPNTCMGGFGPNSELRMPAYLAPDEIQFNPAIGHGSLKDTTWYSVYLKNSRKIWIYTPYGMTASNKYPVVYVHDGDGYLALGQMKNVLDNLIAEGKLQPLIAIFIPPVDRTEEYAGSKQAAFTSFMVNELVPWVDTHYPTVVHPWGRCNLGASNGGNISLWLTVSQPEVFGKVAAMSSNVESNIKNRVSQGVYPPVMYYLDIGTYDIPILMQRVNEFKQILDQQGENYFFQVFHEGHSWGNRKAHIDDALIWLMGSVGGIQNPRFEALKMHYDSTTGVLTLFFEKPCRSRSWVSLYDLNGREVMGMGLNMDHKAPSVHLPAIAPGYYVVKWICRDVIKEGKLLIK